MGQYKTLICQLMVTYWEKTFCMTGNLWNHRKYSDMNFDNLILFHYQYWFLFRQDQSAKYTHLPSCIVSVGIFQIIPNIFASQYLLRYVDSIYVWFSIRGDFQWLKHRSKKLSFKLKKYKIRKYYSHDVIYSQNIPHDIRWPFKNYEKFP